MLAWSWKFCLGRKFSQAHPQSKQQKKSSGRFVTSGKCPLHLHNILWVPFWMKEFEGRFCYFSGILDCRIWLSGRKCQIWETCDFLGERTQLLIVTESANPPPPPPQKSLLFTPGMVSWKAYLLGCSRMCSNGHLLSSTYDPHQHLPNSTNVPPPPHWDLHLWLV